MKIHYLKFPVFSRKTLLSALLWPLVCLGACQQQKQLVFEAQKHKKAHPERVHIFLDRSGSMHGFFHRQKSDAVDFISELSIDLKQRDIPVHFYSFGNRIDSIADNLRKFKNRALDSNIYVGGNNLYSLVLDSIAQKQQNNPEELYLMLTDGVLSVPRHKSLSAEKAAIKDALAGFSRGAHSIGVFQYRMYYQGIYYAQPHDTKVPHQGKRNFYAFTFGHQRFDGLMQDLLTNQKKAQRYQYFKSQGRQSQVQKDLACAPQLVANQRVKCLFQLPTGKACPANYWNDWEVMNAQKEVMPKVTVQAQKHQENELELILDFSQVEETLKADQPYFLRFKKYLTIDPAWKALEYPDSVQAEPRQVELVDHTKTFQLHTLLSAFHYLYKDSPMLEVPFRVKPYHTNYAIGRLYTFALGQQPVACWTRYLYYLLFGLACVVGLAVGVYVVRFNRELIRNKGPYRRVAIGGLSATVVIILSIGLMYLFNCNTCTHQMSFWTILGHAGLSGLWSLLPFFVFIFLQDKNSY